MDLIDKQILNASLQDYKESLTNLLNEYSDREKKLFGEEIKGHIVRTENLRKRLWEHSL